MKTMTRTLILLNLVAVLSACGFTLRGSVSLPAELQTIGLESTDNNSDFMRELRRALRASNVVVVDSPSAETWMLGIGGEQSQERVLSVNTNARAGEYELSVSIPFQLRHGGNVVAGPETLIVEKVYLADPNSAVAKAEERELIEAEMRRELVNQIMRRLQAISL